MVLRSLEIEGFRNLLAGRIEFDEGVNLLWGENGAGKSNLLEAIYFLFTTRSFRTQRALELIAKGGSGFRLIGEIDTRTGSHRLGIEQEAKKRTLALDGKTVGLEDVLERFSVLAFSSRQMEVLAGGPGERRRFLDRGILALRPGYLREIGTFRRTLAQRNQVLQNGAPPAERAVWDERFADAAAAIGRARHEYCSILTEAAGRHAGSLAPGGVAIQVVYRPSPGPGGGPDGQSAREGILAALARRGADERRFGHTLVGPHRDDARILAGGTDIGRFGSAGEQRTTLLALEVTRMELHREARGDLPLLLVDDVDSDLDERASEALLERVGGAQAFVATCKYTSARRFAPPAHPFQVADGTIRPGGHSPTGSDSGGQRGKWKAS